MIKLDIDDFCQHGCIRFEPELIKFGPDVSIRCEYADRCSYLLRYLEKYKKEKDDGNSDRAS